MDTMVALNIGQNIYYLALYRKSLLTLALWHSVGQSDCYKEIFNDQQSRVGRDLGYVLTPPLNQRMSGLRLETGYRSGKGNKKQNSFSHKCKYRLWDQMYVCIYFPLTH